MRRSPLWMRSIMTRERLVLDHIDNISVEPENHTNSITVLKSLVIGMTHLAEFTRLREVDALKTHGSDNVVFIAQITDKTLMLGCVFDWFAISLVSYLRLVKLIHLMDINGWNIPHLKDTDIQKDLRSSCVSYVKSVAPEVYQWRNKIAAHRAATDPIGEDDLTMLTYSTMPTIAYQSPYYGVGYLRLTVGGGGRLDIEPWSLTEKFESLSQRFWPHIELTKLSW